MRTGRIVNDRLLKNNGFTLIELMITVAIVGILAAIAYPNYTQYVERSRRTDAKAVLLEASQFMERKFTENRSYASVSTGLAQAPREGEAWYNLTVSVPSGGGSYVLTAAPKPGWTPKKCDKLTLSNIGEKGTTSTDSVDECWNR
jgi:type IV pilus assembly protein PilE